MNSVSASIGSKSAEKATLRWNQVSDMARAIGIDLGTTNSAAAVISDSGKPEILLNQEGNSTTASVVLFQDFGTGTDEPLVGELAKRQAAAFPDDVVQHVKRYMGDPYWIFDSPSGQQYTAEEISAIILKRIKQDAEAALGEEVTHAVITVPAYFDDARRTATKQAGEIAGFTVLRVLNEPTAAALSYGLGSSASGNILVYDLGGGTFDVTILKIEGTNFEVLATDGDRNLGGFDFDNALMNVVASQLAMQGAKGVLDDVDLLPELREKCEFAKKSLTNVNNTSIQIVVDGNPYRVAVSRADFEQECRSLLNRTEELIEDTLEAASLARDQIDHILLIGGSTRMPAVKDLVQRIFGRSVVLGINPDEAVALGAAVQAAIEYQGGSSELTAAPDAWTKQITIFDVTSQSLGILANDPDSDELKNAVIIPRNSKVPCEYSEYFYTTVDNQNQIEVEVTQGDDSDPEFVVIIGNSILNLVPRPKDSPMEVIFRYDINQTVEVEVIDRIGDQSLGKFEIQRVANLSASQVQEKSRKLSKLSIS